MNKVYLGMLIVLALAFSAFGQTDKTKTPPLVNSAGSQQLAVVSGMSIDAQLQKTVDVNSARVGDEVVLKTTRSIKQNGDVVLAKGTTLIGRITDVQRRTKENSQSRISMIFDRIQGKELSLPISASIVSITNAAVKAGGDPLMSDVSGSSQTSGGASTGGSAGGGLLGGVGNTVGGLVNTTAQTAGAVTNTVGSAAGTATGVAGRSLSGLHISSSASGSANSSTTLSSNRNVRIEKGATFNLRVDGKASAQE